MMSAHTHTHRGYVGNLFYNVSDHSSAAEETGLSSFLPRELCTILTSPAEGNKCVPGPVIVHSAAVITKRCRILLPGIIFTKCFGRLQHQPREKAALQECVIGFWFYESQTLTCLHT